MMIMMMIITCSSAVHSSCYAVVMMMIEESRHFVTTCWRFCLTCNAVAWEIHLSNKKCPFLPPFFTQIIPQDLWHFATLIQTESQSWQFFGPVNNDVNIVLMFTALLIIFNCRQNASTLRGPIFTARRYICHATSSFFILHFIFHIFLFTYQI